jgi:hypothetical protein
MSKVGIFFLKLQVKLKKKYLIISTIFGIKRKINMTKTVVVAYTILNYS